MAMSNIHHVHEERLRHQPKTGHQAPHQPYSSDLKNRKKDMGAIGQTNRRAAALGTPKK